MTAFRTPRFWSKAMMTPTGLDCCCATNNRPTALEVRVKYIPGELRALKQWVLWRSESRQDRSGKRKWTKIPYTIDGRPASSTDPTTWATCADVLAAYRKGGWDGIGLIHLPENNLTGIDLDHCRNPETGALEPWAAAIVEELALRARECGSTLTAGSPATTAASPRRSNCMMVRPRTASRAADS
jgi:hypothetical protein